MAEIQKDSIFKTKDATGNILTHYFITKIENLIGGPLGIDKGGTGQTTAAGIRNVLGLGNTTGALPVANGGTGGTTAAAARSALGITPDNIGAATTDAVNTAQTTANTAVNNAATAKTAADNAATAAAAAQTTANGKANASHTHAASQVTAGTLTGQVLANASAQATLTTAQLRNIYAGTGVMTAGSTALTTGHIYLQYE